MFFSNRKNSAGIQNLFRQQRQIFFAGEVFDGGQPGIQNPEVETPQTESKLPDSAQRLQKAFEIAKALQEKLSKSNNPEDQKRAERLGQRLEEIQRACGGDLHEIQRVSNANSEEITRQFEKNLAGILNAKQFPGLMEDNNIAQALEAAKPEEKQNYTDSDGIKYAIGFNGFNFFVEFSISQGRFKQIAELSLNNDSQISGAYFNTDAQGKTFLVLKNLQGAPTRIDFDKLREYSLPTDVLNLRYKDGVVNEDFFPISQDGNEFSLQVRQVPFSAIDESIQAAVASVKPETSVNPNEADRGTRAEKPGMGKGKLESVKEGDTLYVITTTDPLRLRAKPGLNAKIIDQIPRGGAVAVKSDKLTEANDHKWVEVEIGSKTGYMALDFLDKEKPSQ